MDDKDESTTVAGESTADMSPNAGNFQNAEVVALMQKSCGIIAPHQQKKEQTHKVGKFVRNEKKRFENILASYLGVFSCFLCDLHKILSYGYVNTPCPLHCGSYKSSVYN